MIVYLCTDMEGLAGVDSWNQFCPGSPEEPAYRGARKLLTDEVNAAVAGCFDAGADEVRVLDGHGYNSGQNILLDEVDPRAIVLRIDPRYPVRLPRLDQGVDVRGFIGQHAMAGTLNGLFDHTGNPKTICRVTVNGIEQGEPGMMALYAGHYGIPVFYGSGDQAFCEEVQRAFPHAGTTPTKRGTGWATCELYPLQRVYQNIRRDIAQALRQAPHRSKAYRLEHPLQVRIEFAWSELADRIAAVPNVRRDHARIVSWEIASPLDIYMHPCAEWTPPAASSSKEEN